LAFAADLGGAFKKCPDQVNPEPFDVVQLVVE